MTRGLPGNVLFDTNLLIHLPKVGMVHNSINNLRQEKPSFWQKLGFFRIFPFFGTLKRVNFTWCKNEPSPKVLLKSKWIKNKT